MFNPHFDYLNIHFDLPAHRARIRRVDGTTDPSAVTQLLGEADQVINATTFVE